jgi:acetyl esterase/lipase
MQLPHPRGRGSLYTLVLALLGDAAITAQEAPPATAAPAEAAAERAARPPRVPIVAVGSVIRWNVPYAQRATAQQTLDVYAPPDARGVPVVVFVHGGEWAKGDKAEVCYKPKLLNENGIAFVSVNYRLSGEAQHPAQVDDVAAAVRWVRDHADEGGWAPDRIVLMGHSAGCHLVTLVGLDPRPLAKVGLEPADLDGVVAWSGGAYDLVAKVAAGGTYESYIRQNFGDDAEVWRDASPIAHATRAGARPRFLFVSAGDGRASSRELSEAMAAAIAEHGGHALAVTLPGKTHFTADYECGMPGDPTDSGRVLTDFVRGAGAPRRR